MAQNINLNGVVYSIPDVGDDSWGQSLSSFFVAIPQSLLQKSGGSFALTADVNFGATFGLKSRYFSTRDLLPSTDGLVRLAVTDTIGWRNNANSGNILIGVNASDQITIGGSAVYTGGITALTGDVTASGGGSAVATIADGAITNAKVSASAAIAYSKLNLTGAILNADLAGSIAYSKLSLTGQILNADLAGSIALSKLAALTTAKALVSDGSGFVSVSAVTSTELGYLSGVTSAIQTQINSKFTNLLTTTGDMVYSSSGATAARLPIGSANQVLQSVNGIPTWAAVQAGNKNYINYNNFETGTTTGWSMGNVSLTSALPTGVPTFGSGAAGNLAITAVTSGKLAGAYSMSLSCGAALTAGNLVATDALTLDVEDQAKVLAFKCYYSAITGSSSANWSGTSANSLGVAIYDITNSAWIIPAGGFNFVQGSGVGICQGSFQTPSNMTSYRLVVYCANATSGASIAILFDDFYCGPQALAFGPAMSNLGDNPWTPVSTWTANTTPTGKWRRVGDCMQLTFKMALAGAPTATGFTLTIPSGYTIDTAKLASTTQYATALGEGVALDSGTAYNVQFIYNNSTSVNAVYQSATSGVQSGVTATTPFTFGSGDELTGMITVPILGWNSNSVMSADSDSRLIAMRAANSAATVYTSASTVIVPAATPGYDTSGSWDGTNLYTVPVSGKYSVKVVVNAGTSVSVVNGYVNLMLYKNGVSDHAFGGRVYETTATTYKGVSGTTEVNCNAGDTLQIRLNNQSGNSFTSNSTPSENWISISRLSGPAVVFSSETVAARYTTTGVNSIANTLFTTGNFDTKTWDTHGAVTTGVGVWKFTAPITGKYSVKSAVQFQNVIYAAGNYMVLRIRKSGISYSSGPNRFAQSAMTLDFSVGVNDEIYLLAGESISIGIENNRTAGATLLSTSSDANYISIVRVGN